MPNHDKPLSEATLWDILDREALRGLAQFASGTPRRDHPEDALRHAAKKILEEAESQFPERALKNAQDLFVEYAKAWIGIGIPSLRRQRAGQLAERFGAKPSRLIGWLGMKYGLFVVRTDDVEGH